MSQAKEFSPLFPAKPLPSWMKNVSEVLQRFAGIPRGYSPSRRGRGCETKSRSASVRWLARRLCPLQHTRGARASCTGPDLAYRVRDVPAGDAGGRAVHGLEHGRKPTFGVEIGGGCYPDAPRDRGSQIAQDVPEEVGGDHYVEVSRGEHERGG